MDKPSAIGLSANVAVQKPRLCRPTLEVTRVNEAQRSERRVDRLVGLHPYMAFAGEPCEGAVLIFTETYREAKKLGWKGTRGWIAEEYTDVRVRRLREHEAYLMTLWDGMHRIVDDPPTCPVCETWGYPPNADGNGCEYCGGNDVPPNTQANRTNPQG
jgi:hypothetical protein